MPEISATVDVHIDIEDMADLYGQLDERGRIAFWKQTKATPSAPEEEMCELIGDLLELVHGCYRGDARILFERAWNLGIRRWSQVMQVPMAYK